MSAEQPEVTREPNHRRRNVLIAVIVAILVIIAVVVTIVVVNSGGQTRGPASVSTSAPAVAPTAALPQQTAAPIGDDVTVEQGVTVSISEFRAVEGEAKGAGEIAGPAVQFDVTVKNGSGAAIPLDTIQVNLFSGEGMTPLVPLSGPGVTLFPAKADAGASGTATFVFAVAPADRETLTATIDYRAGVPAAVFTGSAPQQ
ncbi:hypothetical protein [Plantibacter sp. YIM 135249]|uniref:hypothetical protein n=1 Tax=Plantibacter sp. YIM 135249 TaxID=3423918 RepID=UPI003D35754A